MSEYNKLFSLEDRVAVVTGGAGLVGSAMAKGLATYGARVIVADISFGNAQQVAESIGKRAVAEHLDIADEASIEHLISKHDRIDIWVNNAYPRTADWGSKFEDIPADSLRRNVDMHLNGYFLCSQQVAIKMKQYRSGNIINLGSTYGVVAPNFSIYNGTQMTMPAAYSAIKGGLITLTRYLATYLASYNIRVNCLSPGGVFDNQPEAFVEAYVKLTPQGRMANPKDLVGPLIFLASDASSYMTGHNLIVDGGWTTW